MVRFNKYIPFPSLAELLNMFKQHKTEISMDTFKKQIIKELLCTGFIFCISMQVNFFFFLGIITSHASLVDMWFASKYYSIETGFTLLDIYKLEICLYGTSYQDTCLLNSYSLRKLCIIHNWCQGTNFSYAIWVNRHNLY